VRIVNIVAVAEVEDTFDPVLLLLGENVEYRLLFIKRSLELPYCQALNRAWSQARVRCEECESAVVAYLRKIGSLFFLSGDPLKHCLNIFPSDNPLCKRFFYFDSLRFLKKQPKGEVARIDLHLS
jgi:hypothetical protein